MSRSDLIPSLKNFSKFKLARYYDSRTGTFCSADCRNFVNADLIAQGVSPLSPETAAIRAGRLMLNEIRRYAESGAGFGFETTLSGRTYLNLVRSLKRKGYREYLFFLWLSDVDLALSRVEGRVKQAVTMCQPTLCVAGLIGRLAISVGNIGRWQIPGFCLTTADNHRRSLPAGRAANFI